MIRVLFDNTEINGNYILNLIQTVQPYFQNFQIGNTVCRQFTLDVKNAGFNSVPDHVYLYEDNGSQTQSNWTKYATLLVDDKQLQDGDYTTFNLTDVMVRFNKDLTYTVTDTCWDILTDICWRAGISLVTQTFYMDDFQITWEDNVTERDFISYVAEVNGGYAYIDADGNLNIAQYSSTPAGSVDMNKVEYFKIGERHYIDRVYVELASATKFYPATTNNDTLYLNPENILFNDAQGYTIDGIIQHIYSVVNGLEFYNIKIDNCITLPNVRACQIIQFGESGNWTPFLCTVNFSYNTAWRGGYETDLDCKLQEETQIVTSAELVKRINIKVDRETGEIRQEISDLDEQTTASLLLKVDKDGDEIISLINASADNIVLNAKSLIFGEYPNGNYIEEKNYYDGSNNIGVTFDGTGYVRFRPQQQFIIDNIDSNSQLYNRFRISGGSTYYMEMINYKRSANEIANELKLNSSSTLESITVTNHNHNLNGIANRIYMNSDTSNSIVFSNNKIASTNSSNEISLSSGSTRETVEIANGKWTSGSYTYNSNYISLQRNQTDSLIYVRNRYPNTNSDANHLLMFYESGYSSVELANLDSNGSFMNYLQFNKNNDNTARLYAKSDLRLISDGAVRVSSAGGQDIVLDSNDDLHLNYGDKLYINGKTISLDSSGYVKWSS